MRTGIEWAPETLPHPGWLAGYLRDGVRLEFPNVRLSVDGPPLPIEQAIGTMLAASPTWEDLAWIREQWDGPIAVKGIITREDARRAVDEGADAIIMGNHGGNALDGTPASLRMLPEVVDEVGDEVEVILEGGVRRAGDVVKALALGARAVLVGRAYVWALAAGGQDGVRDILASLRTGIDRTLVLLGCPSVHALDPSYVDVPAEWAATASRQPRMTAG